MSNLPAKAAPSSISRPPEPMHQALAVSLSRALSALDENGFASEALPSGPRAGLTQRRALLRSALEPCGPQRAAPVLATLAAMSFRGEPSREMMAAMGKQDIADLSDLPEWALSAAARGYRLGEIGDGRWRPTAGELRQTARSLAAPWQTELHRIGRVLDAPLLTTPGKPATAEQRAAVLAGLKGLAARMEGV